MKIKYLWCLLPLVLGSLCYLDGVAHSQPLTEVGWSKIIAEEKGGKTEVVTPDGSRADIVTETYAYEVEWVEKWKEAPAQARFYGISLNKKPAIVLLMNGNSSDKRYYLRCLAVCQSAIPRVRVEVYHVNR